MTSPTSLPLTTPNFSLCVYCGSRPGHDHAYTQAAQAVGRWIGTHGGQLVYGGGRTGLMGQVAEATRLAGGRVVGIIPQALVDREVANPLCDELHVVANMHQRKAMMAERSHAFLALPGGIGTFEELFEVWTWRQLGYHDKPIGILNVAGYYDSMLQFLHSTVSTEFMGSWQMELVHTDHRIPELLAYLVQAAGTSPESQPLEERI
ncbi:MAG: TIGR00730 family Rossman fold protein [Comamonas sp.]|nr:TIGR00730 family Rossman fold protein [Comamonas sp.]